MISDDMMTFIKNDIVIFGIGVFIFIILTLWIIFQKYQMGSFAFLGCATSVIIMIGLLKQLDGKLL